MNISSWHAPRAFPCQHKSLLIKWYILHLGWTRARVCVCACECEGRSLSFSCRNKLWHRYRAGSRCHLEYLSAVMPFIAGWDEGGVMMDVLRHCVFSVYPSLSCLFVFPTHSSFCKMSWDDQCVLKCTIFQPLWAVEIGNVDELWLLSVTVDFGHDCRTMNQMLGFPPKIESWLSHIPSYFLRTEPFHSLTTSFLACLLMWWC